MRLLLPGRAPLPLMGGTDPIRGFNPGWQAEALFTLLDPVWVLVLRHEDDSVACWHVDSGGLLCTPPQARSAPERREFAGRLQGIGLWLKHAPGRPIRVAVPDAVRAWLALPPAVQRELDALLGADPLVPLLPDPSLLRHNLQEPPPLLFTPVPGTNGNLVGNPGEMVPLVAGEALAELLPGWEIASLEAAFTPLLAVILRHRDGHEATWFIDLDGRLVSHAISLLPTHWQDHLARSAGPLLSALWSGLVLGVPDLRLPEDGIARLPSGDLVALVPLHLEREGHAGDTRVWTLDVPPPPGLAYVVPAARGLLPLDREAVERALGHGLHAEMDRLLREGRMVWPSPVDGTAVEGDGFALLLDQDCFSYRFRQDATGLVFHVVCTGTYFYNHALYFPTADLLVARTPELAAACGRHFTRGRGALLGHLLAHHAALAAGASLPRDPVVQQFFGACAIHIGHYVWQDLAGLAFLLRRAEGHGRLPQLQMFSSNVVQAFFGPEERIFPVLDGRITRHAHRFEDHVSAFYRSGQRVIRYTAISVPAGLGPAVVAAGNAAPLLRDDRLAADAARASGPVILFGIRVGNRTLDDIAGFAADLVRHLGRSVPNCTVVVDGLNDQHDRGNAARTDVPADGDLAQEFALASAIVAAGRDAGVRVVDIVNRSALCSVVWCARADCFVAPLGAALAKYRWICNTPGLVLSSRWNLEHRADLHIYDAPAALEGSSEMSFNRADEVRDCTPDRDAGGVDGRGNFVVSRPAIFDRLVDLLRRHAGARSGMSRMG